MNEKDFSKNIELGLANKDNFKFSAETFWSFFEYSPISLWIEDFSLAHKRIEELSKKRSISITEYLELYPEVISELAPLVKVIDVNSTTLKLYKAKSKDELFQKLDTVFTEDSNIGFSKLLTDLLLGKSESEIETVNKTLCGERIDVSIKFNTIPNEEELFNKVIVSIEDITKKIKSRKELIESENRYKEAQELAKLGSWFYDDYKKELRLSDEIFDFLGAKPHKSSLTLEYFMSFIHKEDLHLVGDYSFKGLLKKPFQKLSYRIKTVQGKIKYVTESRRAIIENNRVTKVIGIVQDISENILNEQNLNTTKNLLSNTLSSLNDGLVILDYNSNYLFVNNEAELLLGKNAKELLGKSIWEEFPEKKGDLFYDKYQIAIETKEPQSFENYFKPWDKWFENRIIPSDEGLLIFFQEITLDKNRENKIKEAYNIINKSSSVAFLFKNEWDFPIEFVSENAEKLYGYTYKEFLENNIKIFEVVVKEDLPYIREKVFSLLKSNNPSGFVSKPFRIRTKNKEEKWVEANVDVIKDFNGKITHIQGVSVDVSERKKAEELLFRSNQRLKDQFNNTPLASIIFDLDFKIVEWNNSAERIFGYTLEEVRGKEAKDLLTPPHLLTEMKTLRKTLFVQNESFKNTNQNITKNGDIITCDWYTVTLRDAQNKITGRACLVDDITDSITSKTLLENSEKKYRNIFEKSYDPVFLLKEGLIVDCNNAALGIFGYDRKSSMININPSEISPEIQPKGEVSFELATKHINNAIEHGSSRFFWTHRKKEGDSFPAEVTLTRINEEDNPLIHAVVIDISEKVKKEQLESILYTISKEALTIDSIEEFSLFIKNELHEIINTNNFYIAFLNEETGQINIPFLVDEKESFITDFKAKGSLTGHVIETQESLIIKRSNYDKLVYKGNFKSIGVAGKVWLGVPLISNKKGFGAIVVKSYSNAYTYSKSDVKLLEFVADQLSLTIQRKKANLDLNEALLKAQESDKLKSAFLANISHEIRTPMNGIIGFSELLLDPKTPNDSKKHYAEIVINSSKQLLAIVNDVLDISKIEAGAVTLNYESVNINKLLDDIYEFFEQKSNETKVDLTYSKGLENFKSNIKIDKTKLNQVLNNLLSNAFKFTNKGEIKFGYVLKNEYLEFFVKDTGIGIDKNHQDRIFERFTQANLDLHKKNKGTGLGLAISKKFVELFKGDIWLESNNNGTSVYFTIPYEKPSSNIVKSAFINKDIQISKSNDRITILVADDEEYNRLYINELFLTSKLNIIEAANGQEAIDLINTGTDINLILMDIKMPVLNGIEAMKIIKEKNKNIPIIALSAFAMESDQVKAIELGFDDYLSKPLDKNKLFNIIEKYSNK